MNSPTSITRVLPHRGSRADSVFAGGFGEAHLGIDLGSTGTRVVISPRDTTGELGGSITVKCKDRRFNQSGKREDEIEFPSDCSVDGHSRLVQASDLPNYEWTSAKYLVYFLSQSSGEPLEETQIVERLKDVMDESTARKALLEHFGALSKRVSQVCDKNGLVLTSVTVSTPTQWLGNDDLIEEYAGVVARSFKLEGKQVHTCLESQAIAHAILSPCKNKQPPRELGLANMMVTFDLGGHSASSSIFAIRHDRRNFQSSYFDMKLSKGAFGGCEKYLQGAGDLCAKRIREVIRTSPSIMLDLPSTEDQWKKLIAPLKDQFLKRFIESMKQSDSEEEFSDDFVYRFEFAPKLGEEPKIWKITVDGKDLRRIWDMSMDHVKGMIQDQLDDVLVQMETHRKNDVIITPLVLASGGTAKAPPIQTFLEQECTKRGLLSQLRFAHKLECVDIKPTSIAEGASLIGGMQGTVTVQTFIERGPAQIALQMRQAGDDDIDWERVATLLLTGRAQNAGTKTIPVKRGDWLRLVCRPFPTNNDPIQQDKELYQNIHDGFYDLACLIIEAEEDGSIETYAEWVGQGAEMVLKIWLRWLIPGHDNPWNVGFIPYYFDPGCNCIIAGTEDDQWEEDRLPEFEQVLDSPPGSTSRESSRDLYDIPSEYEEPACQRRVARKRERRATGPRAPRGRPKKLKKTGAATEEEVPTNRGTSGVKRPAASQTAVRPRADHGTMKVMGVARRK